MKALLFAAIAVDVLASLYLLLIAPILVYGWNNTSFNGEWALLVAALLAVGIGGSIRRNLSGAIRGGRRCAAGHRHSGNRCCCRLLWATVRLTGANRIRSGLRGIMLSASRRPGSVRSILRAHRFEPGHRAWRLATAAGQSRSMHTVPVPLLFRLEQVVRDRHMKTASLT
jgi:hypothetical protein